MEKLEQFLASCAEQEVSPLPVSYFFLRPSPPESVAIVRLAESDFYRTRGYECSDFHKPISRPFGEVKK